MSDRIDLGTRPAGIRRDLCTLHAFGMLVIALHDGRLMAVAIADADEAPRSMARRANRDQVRKEPVIAWRSEVL